MNMYDLQNELPRLPLPSLEDTCNKLLEWSKPLLSKEEFTASKQVVEAFMTTNDQGPFLHNQLLNLKNKENTLNWLKHFGLILILKIDHLYQ